MEQGTCVHADHTFVLKYAKHIYANGRIQKHYKYQIKWNMVINQPIVLLKK